MNKETLKQYLCEAIDSLSEYDLEHFLIQDKEPDLMSVAEEIISIKGELKKMNNVSLRLNNNIQSIFEKKDAQNSELSGILNEDLTRVLEQIVDFDELLKRTNTHFDELPELTLFNLSNFKNKFLVWKGGFKILTEKWEHLINNADIKRTGREGDEFNPLFHEATAVINISSLENNMISEYQELGYLYKNNLIKRAKVIVNKVKNIE